LNSCRELATLSPGLKKGFTEEKVLSVKHLGAAFGKSFRIEDVSFSVRSGERVVILGPNGSGKTSLLRLILGLETPETGSISWSDRVLSKESRVLVLPEDRSMGILFQEGALFPHLGVRENVAVALPPGTPGDAGRPLVDRALDIARIRHLEDRSVPALSGGEQQRVALARALVQRPGVLLLDEPLRSLDGPSKREILSELRLIVEKEDMAALLVTHDTQEAALFADRVVVLREGRKIQEGSFAEIYDRPADRFTADFLGPVQTIEAEKARRWGLGLPEGSGAAVVLFRPEHLVLTEVPDTEARGLEVARVQSTGALLEIAVMLPDKTELLSRAPAHASPGPGRKVSARIVQALSLPITEEPES
jgi:ABC-type Fe3+/spermidine/putrescine transport system ATPase subunit